MSGQTEYEVVEPKLKSQLFARLIRAAQEGDNAHFAAVSLDDPDKNPSLHDFIVKVTGIWFANRPVCDVEDQDGNLFKINFYAHEMARFTIHYP